MSNYKNIFCAKIYSVRRDNLNCLDSDTEKISFKFNLHLLAEIKKYFCILFSFVQETAESKKTIKNCSKIVKIRISNIDFNETPKKKTKST